ncbi:fibronectin type III domain-containing protein [Marinobacter segnicrescens]
MNARNAMMSSHQTSFAWSLLITLSLVLAGCGGSHSGSNDTADNRPGPAAEETGGFAAPETDSSGPVAERPVLHWDSPLTREDGSKLYPGEISGYRIYYRLRHEDGFRALKLEGPDAHSLALDHFNPGAYEFAVSTLDINGMESRRSEPVTVDLI